MGHITTGYYENNSTSVITGYTFLYDGYDSDPLATLICGFSSKMLNQTVSLKAYGVAQYLSYTDGNYTVIQHLDFDRYYLPTHPFYSLDKKELSNMYCLKGFKTFYPHTYTPPKGDGYYEITWNGHKFIAGVKVKSWINFSNCSH